MKHFAFALFMTIGALGSACGEDAGGQDAMMMGNPDLGGGGGNDTGIPPHDGGMVTDTGMPLPDTGIEVMDTGMPPPDGGMNADAEPDAGNVNPLPEMMEAGEYVQVAEARINIGDGTDTSANVDTYATVKQKLGAGTRSLQMNTRSYEWMLSNNVHLTIWFGNTNLDNDDDPPADVDDSDEVLWIAIDGGYLGKTTRDVGIGTARMDVEMVPPNGYGPPAHTAPITMPSPGTLATYYTFGILVAYDMNDVVRTVTICRAYNTEPSADIVVGEAKLDFPIGPVFGFHNLITGTNQVQVLATLGYPDGEGDANNFHVWSYAFIGVELFFFGSQHDVFLLSVHAPYFGALENTTTGLGASKMDFETALGMGPGVESGTMNLFCYPDDMTPEVLVSYTNGEASTITMGFLTCP